MSTTNKKQTIAPNAGYALAVKGLGEKQKEVLRYLLKNCSIYRSQCTSTGETDITVSDDDGNYFIDVSEKTLQSLINRKLLNFQEETMCLQQEDMRYFLDSRYKAVVRAACA